MKISKGPRKFVAENLEIIWSNVEPYYTVLLQEEWTSVQSLELWLLKRSELESVLEEDFAWRYIKMTCNTTDEKLTEDFEYFAREIEPKISEYGNLLNKKLAGSDFFELLDHKKYGIYRRAIQAELEIFRTENIPLFTELQILQQKYGATVGQMSIEYKGEQITLEQASNYLKDTNRAVRQEVYELIQNRRLQDREVLDQLFTELVQLRHQVALNAGFSNYRDYMFKALGRFDYTVEDCLNFHNAIEKSLMPVMEQAAQARKTALEVDNLRPFDTEVDPEGKSALVPFHSSEELVAKTISAFEKIDLSFAEMIKAMQTQGYLDLESRLGKAPGGYNYPLSETGAPFIFMNSANSFRDLTTMVHEAGHAVHTFLSNSLALNDFKKLPSEVAELASMSMELLSMDQWHVFFNSDEDLTRAKREQLHDCLKTLPWVACIDAFQHWIYTNPFHTIAERETAWIDTLQRFSVQTLDWTGYEHFRKNMWQKQLHLFEVPFYYIEYGIAQLGAIGIFRNYRTKGSIAVDQYKEALSLGYTKTIPEIYQTAGVSFNFDSRYVQELLHFVQSELQSLKE